MAHLQPMTRFQHHYRHQLDNKNRLIYDLLCRQRVYLSRLRDFICRIPNELRRQAHEKLMESLEHLELNFNQSQEEFYHLQNVIKNLEPGPDCDLEDFPASPPMPGASSSSSSSFGLPSASPSTSPSAPVAPRKRQRKTSAGVGEASVAMETSTAPAAKRRRRKGSRAEESGAGRLPRTGAAAAVALPKTVVPRPCSSSSENANSPPSPMSTPQGSSSSSSSSCSSSSSLAAMGRWSQSKTQGVPSSSFSQLTPKSMVSDLQLCPNEEDNILPDFSLFG